MRRHSPGPYSRFVAILKVALPAAAVVMLALVFLLERDDELEGGLFFTGTDLAALGDGVRLTNPQLSGSTRAGDRYAFTADSVLPADDTMQQFTATALSGTIEEVGGRTIRLAAEAAVFDRQSQTLTLETGVKLLTSDGYTASADRIDAQLGSATIVASGAVEADGPAGRIRADTLTIAPDGDAPEAVGGNRRISFAGGVSVTYLPATE